MSHFASVTRIEDEIFLKLCVYAIELFRTDSEFKKAEMDFQNELRRKTVMRRANFKEQILVNNTLNFIYWLAMVTRHFISREKQFDVGILWYTTV